MPCLASKYFDVVWSVVLLVPVFVMNLFLRQKTTTEYLFGYESVLVGISSDVGKMMILADSNQHIPIRRNGFPALPHTVFLTDVPDSHFSE